MPGALVTLPTSLEVKPILELIRTSIFVMRRLLKPKPPVTTSTSPTGPAELVPGLTSRRDSSALAALSAAIALPIGSAFNDTRDTPSVGATVQGTDSIQETAFAAVRMAIEGVKEASDLCPPLKAVAGALFVLIKNYDVGVPILRTEHLLILSAIANTV